MRFLGLSEVQSNGKIKEYPKYTSLKSTIPKDAAEKLNIKPGDKVIFCETDSGDVIIRKNGHKKY